MIIICSDSRKKGYRTHKGVRDNIKEGGVVNIKIIELKKITIFY